MALNTKETKMSHFTILETTVTYSQHSNRWHGSSGPWRWLHSLMCVTLRHFAHILSPNSIWFCCNCLEWNDRNNKILAYNEMKQIMKFLPRIKCVNLLVVIGMKWLRQQKWNSFITLPLSRWRLSVDNYLYQNRFTPAVTGHLFCQW